MNTNSNILAGILFVLFQILAFSARAEDVAIALESAGVRATPQFFASVHTSLPYGTRVKVIASEGAWAKIQSGKTLGWIHNSAFAKAQPILRDLGKGNSKVKDTYKDEVATAGKGFNEASAVRGIASESNFPFDVVDQIECRKVAPAELQNFMKAGGLKSQTVGE